MVGISFKLHAVDNKFLHIGKLLTKSFIAKDFTDHNVTRKIISFTLKCIFFKLNDSEIQQNMKTSTIL